MGKNNIDACDASEGGAISSSYTDSSNQPANCVVADCALQSVQVDCDRIHGVCERVGQVYGVHICVYAECCSPGQSCYSVW